MPPTPFKTLALVAGLLFAGGLIAIGVGVYQGGASEAVAHWKKARGGIESAKYSSTRLVDYQGGNGLREVLTGHYTYEVNGKSYREPFRLVWTKGGFGPSRLRSIYVPEKPVAVHYDPDLPRQSTIDPPSRGAHYVPNVVGGALVIVGFIVSGYAFRARRREQAKRRAKAAKKLAKAEKKA